MKADFLFELGTEELPSSAVEKLGNLLLENLCEEFKKLNLNFNKTEAFATPRRLGAKINELDCITPQSIKINWGPSTSIAFDSSGNLTKAGEAFANKFKLDRNALNQFIKQDGSQEKLCYEEISMGVGVETLFQQIILSAITKLPISKKMRWGANRDYFLRPVRWAVLMFGEQTHKIELFSFTTGNKTRGHRFHSDSWIPIKSPESYESQLLANKVIASFEKRKEKIIGQIKNITNRDNLNVDPDDELLNEVTGLCEWPVALLGNFKNNFLSVPSEALISSMREHQKYFHTNDKNNNLCSSFITISNIESKSSKQVIAGNEKVVNARLSDAMFFYEQDTRESLHSKTDRLKQVVFQKDLGSIYDKTQRIKCLSEYLCKYTKANIKKTQRASELCKTDLITDMVNEFPDLQGVMGGYYATHDGEDKAVSTAISEHYLPRFSKDKLPSSKVGITLSLSDKLDSIISIFSTGAKPSGSKDPYGLRRASLAIIKILIKNKIDLNLLQIVDFYEKNINKAKSIPIEIRDHVINYILDRFEGLYKEQGYKTESYLSVKHMSLTSPLDIHERVQAVDKFSKDQNAIDLVQLYKRVTNILIKNKHEKIPNKANISKMTEDYEINLHKSNATLYSINEKAHLSKDYDIILKNLLTLKVPIDEFFENVMVDVKDKNLKLNRLALLKELKKTLSSTADLTLIA